MTSAQTLLSPSARRGLLAFWLSLAVHAAIIGMVRVAPRTVVATEQVLEARLENALVTPPQAAKVTPVQPAPEPERPTRLPEKQPKAPVPSPSPQPETGVAPEPVSESASVSQAKAESRPNNPEPIKSEPIPTIDIPLAVDTHYYAAKELDIQPRPVRKIVPSYPAEYETQGIGGHAILDMRVETDGRVSDLKQAEVFPAGYQAFGREALKAFQDVKFIPARRNGQVVRAQFRVKVVFEVED